MEQREYNMAKEYLKRAYRLNELIKSKESMLGDLRRLAVSITPIQYTGSGGVHNSDSKPAGTMGKIIDLERQLNKDIDRYIDLKAEIIKKLDGIENKDYRLILEKRYLLFMTWERIAEGMSITIRWVHILHKRALKEFETVHCNSLLTCDIIKLANKAQR